MNIFYLFIFFNLEIKGILLKFRYGVIFFKLCINILLYNLFGIFVIFVYNDEIKFYYYLSNN